MSNFIELKNNRGFITKEGVYKNKLGTLLKGTIRHGYHFVYTGSRQERTHRLVVEAFIGEIKDGFEVNHIDGNKLNNNVSNLEIVSHLENMSHASRNGLYKPNKGTKNGNSSFTEEQIKEIRSSYIPRHPEYSGFALAKKYGVSCNAISYIINRGWKHLTN